MTKRKKKKVARIVHLSAGPLPQRLALHFPDHALVFTDASRLHHGGLAAIIYRTAEAQPEIFTRSVPLDGSNELELKAAVFGLQQAALLLPEQPFALFSDNQDAIVRLTRVKHSGATLDPQLASLFPDTDFDTLLRHASLSWVQGHGHCRGNALADEQARVAASGKNGEASSVPLQATPKALLDTA